MNVVGKKSISESVFVLDDFLPHDVARAMIKDGRQKEPFHILDLNEVYQRIQHFKNMMPRVQMFYAMKANDCEMVLKLAVSQGLGFDCASPGEIYKLRLLNVDPTSIIYAMPTKTPEQMIYGRESGVKHTTFDTSYELKKIKQYWPQARLLIRIRVDGDSIYKLGKKFGCDFDTEAVDLLEEAADLGLQVVGVAFHVGSACFSIDSYTLGLMRVKALFEHEAQAGRQMKIVDIGGGFLSDTADRIDQVSYLINSSLEELFPDPEIQVIAEPGRYLCDSSMTLYCNITNVRQITKKNKNLNIIYINDGIFGTLRCSEPWHTVEKLKWDRRIQNEDLEDAILYGPSCDCDDQIMKDFPVSLPRCTSFDWLVFGIQGAYTITFSSKFSSLEIPMMRTVISMDLWNKIKYHPVIDPNDMILNPDISSPLKSSLPPIVPKEKLNQKNFTATLT